MEKWNHSECLRMALNFAGCGAEVTEDSRSGQEGLGGGLQRGEGGGGGVRRGELWRARSISQNAAHKDRKNI